MTLKARPYNELIAEMPYKVALDEAVAFEKLQKEKQAIVDGMNHLVNRANEKLERYAYAAAKWHRIEAAIAKDPNVRALPDYIRDEYYDETECGP